MTIKESTEDRSVPPYVPWKAFLNFFEHLKETTLPTRVDNSMMPPTMSGGTRGYLKSALKFLGLIREDGTVEPRLHKLIEAYGTPTWSTVVRQEIIEGAYSPVIGDLDHSRGTSQQLKERFRQAGKVEGEMLDRCIRFYLAALKAAGANISPHFQFIEGSRKRLKASNGKMKKGNADSSTDEEEEDAVQTSVSKFRLPIPGKADAIIQLPKDVTLDDWKMLEEQIRAYVRYSSGDKT